MIEVDVNDFLICLSNLLLAEWSDCNDVVESIMLSILTVGSGNIFDYKVEV